MARAMAILSATPRKFSFRNDPSEMRGRGKHAALEDGSAPAGFDEEELAMKADFVLHAQPPVEIEQIDAAAQQHVLAVVDHFTRPLPPTGHDVARPPRKGARFVEIDFESRAAQSDGRGEAREAASDNSNARHGEVDGS